jgi:hypothetical protein
MAALRDGKFVVPGAAAQATSYLRFVSSKGDYIGGGKDYWCQGNEMTVRRFDTGVGVGAGGWGMQFAPPRGGVFQAGEYLDAKRWPFNDNAPGISISGHGRGCNQVAGLFRVWEFQTEDDQVTRLAIDFIHKCEITGPPLYGMVRYKSRYQ